jgi:hypothetical protein
MFTPLTTFSASHKTVSKLYSIWPQDFLHYLLKAAGNQVISQFTFEALYIFSKC